MLEKIIDDLNIPSAPPYLDIDLTNQCNVFCEFCSVSATNRKREGELEPDQWRNFFNSLEGLPVFKASLLGGEPLMVPEIFEYIQILSSQTIDTTISTNGWMLSSSVVTRLKTSGLTDIQVSLDFPTPELHDISRHKKGLFKKAIEGIRIARDSGIPVTVNFLLTRDSLRFVSGMRDLAENLGVGLVLSEFKPTGYATSQISQMVDLEEVSHIMNSDHVSAAPFFKKTIAEGKNYCAIGLDRLYINELGEAYPCDLYRGNTEKILGKITDIDIVSLWTKSETLNTLRNYKYSFGTKAPKDSICGSCSKFSSCRSGCIALSAEHNAQRDYYGDPRCVSGYAKFT